VNSFAGVSTFVIKKKIGYYSIQSENKDLSEAEDFFYRMENIPEYADQLEKFAYWMNRIGDNNIADNNTFRHEGICEALPPDRRFTEEDLELRLYCHIVSSHVVILFNGDRKTPGAKKSQDCPLVFPHHKRAMAWTTKLKKEEIETIFTKITNQENILIIY
jgi:hypothetical protein